MKGLLDIGYGTGNPASCPDFRPLNPWGRPMPPPVRPEREKLYQVQVKDRRRGWRRVPVCPKMGYEFCEMIRLTIAQQIALGTERNWSDPQLVLMVT